MHAQIIIVECYSKPYDAFKNCMHLFIYVASQSGTKLSKSSEPEQHVAPVIAKRKSDAMDSDPSPEHGKQKPRLEDSGHVFQLRSFVADRKGEREEMQDAYIQLDDYSKMFKELHPSM